jgi:hypothetical protein
MDSSLKRIVMNSGSCRVVVYFFFFFILTLKIK